MNITNIAALLLLTLGLTACAFNQKAPKKTDRSLTNLSGTLNNNQSLITSIDSTHSESSKENIPVVLALTISQDSTLFEKPDTSQIIKPDTLVEKGLKSDTTLNNNNTISEEEENIRIQITRLERLLNSAWNKYYNIHTLLDRFIKLEATDRLLNIHHYASSSTRLKGDHSGLQFIVQSSFPYHLSKQEAQEDVLKLAKSFTNALIRYSQVSNTDIKQTDSRITIYYEGDTTSQMIKQLPLEFGQLGLPYSIQNIAGNYTRLHITLNSSYFFQKDQKKWEQTEQRINRDIRLLKRRIDGSTTFRK